MCDLFSFLRSVIHFPVLYDALSLQRTFLHSNQPETSGIAGDGLWL